MDMLERQKRKFKVSGRNRQKEQKKLQERNEKPAGEGLWSQAEQRRVVYLFFIFDMRCWCPWILSTSTETSECPTSCFSHQCLECSIVLVSIVHLRINFSKKKNHTVVDSLWIFTLSFLSQVKEILES